MISYYKQINKFKEDIKQQAENLVLNTFPRKTLELHALLTVLFILLLFAFIYFLLFQSSKFNIKNLDIIKTEINIPIPEYPYVNNLENNNHEQQQSGDIQETQQQQFSNTDLPVTYFFCIEN